MPRTIPGRPFQPRGERPPFRIAGALVHATTRSPLAGVGLVAVFAPGTSSGGPATVLGRARTDRGGRFVVKFEPGAEVERLVQVLATSDAAGYVLRIDLDPRAPFETAPFNRRRPLPVPLPVALPEPAVVPGWTEVASRAEEHGITRLSALARALGDDDGDESVFGDWSLAARLRLVAALETAFLDPDGALGRVAAVPSFRALRDPRARRAYLAKVGSAAPTARALSTFIGKTRAFAELSAIDWPIDLDVLRQGQTGNAITKYQAHFEDATSSGLPGGGSGPIPLPKVTDLARYRNYLRNLYTGAPAKPGYAQSLGKLRDRFHQDFVTNDVAPKAANEILIPIVTTILKAPAGATYGFGLAASAIEARGNRTSRAYLDYLVGLSGLSRREFSLRYRLDCERPDTATSNRVQENVATLQGFFRDGIQGPLDPFPIVPTNLRGRAPFFLQYEEWLDRDAPFHAENFLPLRATVFVAADELTRQHVHEHATGPDPDDDVAWFSLVLELEERLAEAHAAFDQGEYTIARRLYQEAEALGVQALWKSPGGAPHLVAAALAGRLAAWRDLPTEDEMDLAAWLDHIQVAPVEPTTDGVQSNWSEFKDWLQNAKGPLQLMVAHACAWAIPCWLGDVAVELGEFSAAMASYGRGTRFLVGRAKADDRAGSPSYGTLSGENGVIGDFFLRDGPLAYTADAAPNGHYEFGFVGAAWSEKLASEVEDDIPPALLKLFRLRQGLAILEWADTLYRQADPSSVARARELYKAGLLLHKASTGLNPHWPTGDPTMAVTEVGLGGSLTTFVPASENPARLSQKTRARLGLAQIATGLNFYGYAEDLVPALRYETLKEAADRLAAAARAAQQDLIAYTGQLEDGLIVGLQNASLLQKAILQGKIAAEQTAIAQYGVHLAQQQVAQVEKAIEDVNQKIDDADDLGTQFADFFSGMGKAIAGLVPVMGGVAGAAGGGAAGGGSAALGEAATAGTGFTYTSSAATAAAGGGLVLGGFALFVYAGYTSMAAMIEARNTLGHQRTFLRDQALPAAQEQVRVAQRGVTIAGLQGQIAAADAELALALLRFQSERFLSLEFWASLLTVARRALRRQLDLGARYAWLAERALAFEQNRPLDVVRLDYFSKRLQGVTGPDLLQSDLAELEVERLAGLRQQLPIKRTLSLAFDQPLAFLQLKQTGRCLFSTGTQWLRDAHPGTYAHRLRAVTVTVKSPASTVAPRGMLRNQGTSIVEAADGTPSMLLRPADALAVSEFQLRDDMEVHGLPGATLMAFEGSGVETVWELELPLAAHPLGLDALADVQVTLDVRASFSEERHAADVGAPAVAAPQLVLFSARVHAGPGLAALQDPQVTPASITFDLGTIGLPGGAGATIRNLAVLFAAARPLDCTAAVTAGGPAIPVALLRGVAHSDAPPDFDGGTSPLNAVAGRPALQPVVVSVDKAGQPGVDFTRVADVVLAIEYAVPA